MSECDRARPSLYQYIADGEPALPAYASLRVHLATCVACRAQAERLRVVEGALHVLPMAAPPVGLAPEVMRQVASIGQPPREEWRLFSWETWVPVVAFAVALLVAMVSMPSNLLTTMTLYELESTLRAAPSDAGGWLSPLALLTRNQLFWVIWTSVFVTLAGLGLSLSLRNLGQEATTWLAEWRARLNDVTDRAWQRVRNAH